MTFLTHRELAEGPQSTERLLLPMIPPDEPNKYPAFIELFRTTDPVKGKDKAALTAFCLGYFHEQAALTELDAATQKSHFEKALSYFTQYIELSKDKSELLFYSLLASGYLKNALGHSWPLSEALFLEAYELFPARGESLEAIIQYYSAVHTCTIAYIYSSFAKEHFFDKRLAISAKWGFNPSFYDWKVLNIHTAVCFELGLMDEAWATYSQLRQRTEQRPDLFTFKEIEKIQSKSTLFQQTEPTCQS